MEVENWWEPCLLSHLPIKLHSPSHPPQFTEWLTHSLTHSLAPSIPGSCTHQLTRPPTCSPALMKITFYFWNILPAILHPQSVLMVQKRMRVGTGNCCRWSCVPLKGTGAIEMKKMAIVNANSHTKQPWSRQLVLIENRKNNLVDRRCIKVKKSGVLSGQCALLWFAHEPWFSFNSQAIPETAALLQDKGSLGADKRIHLYVKRSCVCWTCLDVWTQRWRAGGATAAAATAGTRAPVPRNNKRRDCADSICLGREARSSCWPRLLTKCFVWFRHFTQGRRRLGGTARNTDDVEPRAFHWVSDDRNKVRSLWEEELVTCTCQWKKLRWTVRCH